MRETLAAADRSCDSLVLFGIHFLAMTLHLSCASPGAEQYAKMAESQASVRFDRNFLAGTFPSPQPP